LHPHNFKREVKSGKTAYSQQADSDYEGLHLIMP
jgi:hypothetical protein